MCHAVSGMLLVLLAGCHNTPVTTGPELSAMAHAAQSEGLGIPVDLRYQFEGDPATGQPVLLHLAAVPRVEGRNMTVSIKEVGGIRAAGNALHENQVQAKAAYRQQLSVLREPHGPTELRVLVTMDMPVGTGFSYFTVPLTQGAASRAAAEAQR
jgi:hypothetical protein